MLLLEVRISNAVDSFLVEMDEYLVTMACKDQENLLLECFHLIFSLLDINILVTKKINIFFAVIQGKITPA